MATPLFNLANRWMAATTIDMSQFLASKPVTQPVASQLPPKNSATLWVIANPFIQTVQHFAVALALTIIIFVLCSFVIEPKFPGFFPVNGLITDLLFLIVIVLSVRIVIDRGAVKEKALANLSGFCGALQSALLRSSRNFTAEEVNILSAIPQQYILCLRAKSEGGRPNSSDAKTKISPQNNWQVEMYNIAAYCKSKDIDISRCLEFYENATLTESFTMSRDLDGFVWACAWLYCVLVPFIFWGYYRGWIAAFGLIPIWAILAVAHGFTRNIHLYGLYRKHAATPFDLMEYAIQQSKLLSTVLDKTG